MMLNNEYKALHNKSIKLILILAKSKEQPYSIISNQQGFIEAWLFINLLTFF